MKKRIIGCLLFTIAFSMLLTTAASAETVRRKGWNYDFASHCLLYCDESGSPMKGWLNIGGDMYYAGEDGAILRNCDETVDYIQCSFDKDGRAAAEVTLPNGKKPEGEKTDTEKKVAEMAATINSKIIKDGMTDIEKCRAVYDYMHTNIAYIDTSDKTDLWKAAFDGFRSKSGDCFTYYGMSRSMLEDLGFDTIEVLRNDGHHWWCLVKLDNGWYHLDTTPRRKGGDLCLLTDAEIEKYSEVNSSNPAAYTTHGFDRSKYPSTPEKSVH